MCAPSWSARLCALLAAGVVAVLGALGSSPSRAAVENGSWHVLPLPPGQPALRDPQAISVGAKGAIHVVDFPGPPVGGTLGPPHSKTLSPNGRLLQDHALGNQGASPAVAVSADGSVYMIDRKNGNVSRFSPSGALLNHWRTSFPFPTASPPIFLAVDNHDTVYVAQSVDDTGRTQVRAFSPSGKSMGRWAIAGPGYGPSPTCTQLCAEATFDLTGIAVDPQGNVYASFLGMVEGADCTHCETWQAVVEVRSPPGKVRTRYTLDTDQFALLDVDSAGNLYVQQPDPKYEHELIEKISPTHKVLATWQGDPCSSPGAVSSLAVDSHGAMFAAISYGSNIVKLGPDGRMIARWGGCDGLFDGISRVAVGRDSALYGVASSQYGGENDHAFSVSPDGARLHLIGTRGQQAGQFQYPQSVAVDARGNVYVAEVGRDRILKFSTAGQFLTEWGGPGRQPGQFASPGDIAIDEQGNIDVLDAGNSRIQTFSPIGAVLRTISLPARPVPAFFGLDVDRAGMIYAAGSGCGTAGAGCVLKLSPNGSVVSGWSGFSPPDDVAVDSHGNVYVTVTGENRVLELSPMGQQLGAWGGSGSNPGEFKGPQGVAVDAAGNVYVADTGNNRIQKLTIGG